MHPEMIFGIGSGRCGTGSLDLLFGSQKNMLSTHEGFFLPWEKNPVAFYQAILKMMFGTKDKPIVANVAFYWVNYLSEIFKDIYDPKIVVLKRDKEEVVESFSSMYQDANHWSNSSSEEFDGRDPGMTPLGEMFPSYDLTKKDAIAKYWEYYYDTVDFWMDRLPDRFLLLNLNAAFTETGQYRILKFIGIEEKDMVISKEGFHFHKRNDSIYALPSIRVEDDPASPRTRGLNRIKYGNAGDIVGRKCTIAEATVTEEEMAELLKNPEIAKLAGAKDDLLDNGKEECG